MAFEIRVVLYLGDRPDFCELCYRLLETWKEVVNLETLEWSAVQS